MLRKSDAAKLRVTYLVHKVIKSFISKKLVYLFTFPKFKVNAARKSKVDDNTARMQSIKQLGV